MAASRCSLLLLLLAVALAAFSGFDRADAQAAQPPLDPACQTPFQELGPCLDFASGAAASPSAQCCSGLKDVAANHLECLCELLANPGQFKINLTLALELPALCQVPVSPTACAPAATPPSGTPAPPAPPLPAPPTPPPSPPVLAPPTPPIPAPPVQSPPVYLPPSPAPAPSGSSTPRTSAIGSLLALAAVTLVAALL